MGSVAIRNSLVKSRLVSVTKQALIGCEDDTDDDEI